MDDMQDYRVADWIENGLLKRIRHNFSSIAVGTVILGSAIGLGSASASNLNPVVSAPTKAASASALHELHAAVSAIPSMVRFRELSRAIEHGAANIDNPDTSDIDPEMLALADAAFEKIESRRLSRS